VTAEHLGEQRYNKQLVAPGALASFEQLQTVGDFVSGGPPSDNMPREFLQLLLEIAVPTRDCVPRLDVEFRMVEGNTDPLPQEDVLWVHVHRSAWYMLLDASGMLESRDKGNQWYGLRLDPSDLTRAMTVELERAVLPNASGLDTSASKVRVDKLRMVAERPL
jgi:hypothetical protein